MTSNACDGVYWWLLPIVFKHLNLRFDIFCFTTAAAFFPYYWHRFNPADVEFTWVVLK